MDPIVHLCMLPTFYIILMPPAPQRPNKKRIKWIN